MISFTTALLFLALTLFPLAALADDPEVTVTRFDNLPSRLFYFEDTPVILMQDPVTLTVYRSPDEGKTWEEVSGIEEALRLVPHPHNNEMAFILGRSTTHWVTYNRGVTWQSFTTPREASLIGQTLTFHAEEHGWILFQGVACEDTGSGKWGGGKTCWDETYYTTDAFRTEAQLLLAQTSQCLFARSSPAFVNAPRERVLCVAFDQSMKPGSGGIHSYKESRLYASDDWFATKKYVDLGIGKKARGVVGLGVVSKFMVAALRVFEGAGVDISARAKGGDPMQLYVSTDGSTWRQTKFPHSAMPDLRENAYTVVESTTHSIAVDILTSPSANIGTLFVSSDEGTYFVEALPDTNRNEYGIVDFEELVGLDGVGIANVVSNREEVVGWGEAKKIKSVITYDDGSRWRPIEAPETNINGDDWSCDRTNTTACALHVHSVTVPHNYGRVFSSTAPGFVMAVGSVGEYLLPYEDCDTFLSTDAGLTWRVIQEGAHKYEFGDQGSVLVIADDEEATDHVHYSYDGGDTWTQLDLGVTVRTLLLTTIPDSTSQKFLLLGSSSRRDSDGGRHAMIFLDFAPLRHRQCTDDDFERWYARSEVGEECLMGHKQWYKRRKLDALCYVGHKFEDPVGHEENCPCTDKDYECDFNYVRSCHECVPVGPEAVPAGTCAKQDDQYLGSSGYRLIPGNTCDRESGVKKDEPVMKDCSSARPENGQASHVVHDFSSEIVQSAYFPQSQVVLLQLADSTVWQSVNEGFSWKQLYPDDTFLGLMMHAFSPERAYLLTNTRKIYYTTDTGRSWYTITPPMDPNNLGITLLDFHPTKPDWLIFTGSTDCGSAVSTKCRAVAYYSTDHGRRWKKIEEYVRSCVWARDERLKIDEREIICESYRDKKGSQTSGDYNPVEFIAGSNYYSRKKKLFDSVVGFASFSEYLLVAQLNEAAGTLTLQVSLDGYHFAEGQFPPTMRIENRAYTILESSTDSVFLHLTMNSAQNKEWGHIFKSNSNGTYYGLSAEHVNRNSAGYVDFEKMTGLDGIAVINIVSNPTEADTTGRKKIQTRITHNDGGTWKPMNPPPLDSLGEEYDCHSTSCSLQIHGYTERRDPRATYSSPSAVGLMLAVGNVGEELAPYTDSDIFLTRDGGFTWEEVHKDAHMWEFGDSGSIIVLVNDEAAVDHVVYTLDEGLSWNEYTFGETLRVKTIQTVPEDTSRRFLLFGTRPGETDKNVVVHLDFSQITQQKCQLKIEDPNHDDFELWSPSEGREEACLFGRQTMYHRRIRDRNCYVGEKIEQPRSIVRNCTCTPSDFECEFNYYRDSSGSCVLVEGAMALSSNTEEEQCTSLSSTWYERTAYRKIPHSSCEGGQRPDRGSSHSCPGLIGARHGGFWITTLAILPFLGAGIGGWWWYARSQTGAIRLGEHRAFGGGEGNETLDFIASIPIYVVGTVKEVWAWTIRKIPFLEDVFGRRLPYRQIPIDDDAEILATYEDE
ncbi:signal sequence binding protein [Tremella mesenterica]|uniref:Vacuolar protein sorting/targeting protein 10 n=1 Tax=Tremella mesenterica TaxID=5217 RepID=A0A4Q1BT38_TREME|nr:signal sequence binding protein [Tremella mesenterica]